jgi:drug/metabolite transporter (DMT)-like permease
MPQALVVTLVLLAAVLHATWNALVKQSGERLLTFSVVVGTCAAIGLPIALVIGLPARASWAFVAGSAAIHFGYYTFLLLGYRYGDLGVVYPIARGVAPLLIAVGSAVFAGEPLGPLGAAGVALVSIGLASLAPRSVYAALARLASRRRASASEPVDHAPRSVAFALATGVCVAGYMLCDGLGVRASGRPLAYIATQEVAAGAPFALGVWFVRRRRVASFFKAHGRRAVLGGAISASAYAIVMWAMSVSHLAYVSALRETSVIVAALIGAVHLKEAFGRRRVAAACVVALGIVLMSAA